MTDELLKNRNLSTALGITTEQRDRALKDLIILINNNAYVSEVVLAIMHKLKIEPTDENKAMVSILVKSFFFQLLENQK